MLKKFALVVFLSSTLLSSGCASHSLRTQPELARISPKDQLIEFDHLLATHPDKVWSPKISEKLKSAIRDYNSRKRLENGLIYGASVRAYSLKSKCASDVERDMKALGCAKRVDEIRDPIRNKPILMHGKPTPIWQFVCPDGGVVKIKPKGDPSSKYTPFPHGSRTLRYPGASVYRDYRDEVAKVSEDGHIIPRSPADLAPKNLVDGWSMDAHIPLVPCK